MAKLIYEGSVKNLYEVDATTLEFEYTDAYSVFDWGRMPDALSGKGESLAALGEYFFREAAKVETWKRLRGSAAMDRLVSFHGGGRSDGDVFDRELADLERNGLKHHLIRRSAPNCLLVRRVPVFRPAKRSVAGLAYYDYTACGRDEPTRLVPLEVVFRFGIPKGSSLLDRLTKDYARQLGFGDRVPAEGEGFGAPILEFFTKLEPTDRFLTVEQAFHYSGLTPERFSRLIVRTLWLSVWLSETMRDKGLELWDGKFEWAMIDGELALVDSIGPDELRLLDPATGAQFSKEFLRQFYRATPWYAAVQKAKASLGGGEGWKTRVRETAGEPPPLSREFRAVADVLYPSLALAVTGANPEGRAVGLSELRERVEKCLGRANT